MGKLIFALALVLTAGVLSLITGKNKRQIARIPEEIGSVCQPPGKRYVMYALGVVVVVFVAIFSVLYIMDEAPEDARFMWGLCVAIAVLTFVITTLGGNVMARDCVYFDGEKIQIEKAFREPRIFKWSDIKKMCLKIWRGVLCAGCLRHSDHDNVLGKSFICG